MHIPPIRCDSRGHGYYGAPRGDRGHNGIDLVCEPMHPVRAFKGGIFTKYGYCYSDDLSYRYVEVKDKEGFRAQYFYTERTPELRVGDKVNAGAIIGFCQNVAARYYDPEKEPMTNHTHLQIKKDRLYIDPQKYIAEA